MKKWNIRVWAEKERLPKEKQLAWGLAELALGNRKTDSVASEMVGNRIIDNAAVAIAAIQRRPVASAREQALAHPRKNGATLFGVPADQTFECEWATWANNVAVRELDMHDTFLAADYSHPGDNIPPLLAVAQQTNQNGADLLLGILTAYEVQIQLVKAICLHEFKKDHIAHLAPATAAGIGTLLKLDVDTIYQAINQAVHLSFSTRQSRKGQISSWKAYAPAWAGKLAVEAVDRAMRGEGAPAPVYEGEDSVIAWMLGGKVATYEVLLPEKGEPCRAILESYTKEHSAEYQSQALIDMAFNLHRKKIDLKKVKEVVIHTSHHTHYVIGTGSNDPQKMDPNASRETLDHSAMYILAVAWEDGRWHHVDSYSSERAKRAAETGLWQKIRTVEEKEWTDAYHAKDPSQKSFGAELEVVMQDGTVIRERMANANAHPNGASPLTRPGYIKKFKTLTDGIVDKGEEKRFLNLVENLARLSSAEVKALNPVLRSNFLQINPVHRGIF